MEWNIFPTTPEAILTITGAAAICAILTQWLKDYLPDWRFTNLLALGVTLIVTVVASFLLNADLFQGVLVGLFGASLATYGYETLSNLLGLIGVGNRK